MVANSRSSVRTSASTCSFWVDTEVNSPRAIENAPATRPDTPLRMIVCADAPAPPTPAMRLRLVTRPSIAPKVAARSCPPATLAWV